MLGIFFLEGHKMTLYIYIEGQSTNQRDLLCFPSARKSQLVLQFFLGKVDAKKINAIINIYGKNQVTHQVIKLKCSTN